MGRIADQLIAGRRTSRLVMPPKCSGCNIARGIAKCVELDTLYAGLPDFPTENGAMGDDRRGLFATSAENSYQDLNKLAQRAVDNGCSGSILGFCRLPK